MVPLPRRYQPSPARINGQTAAAGKSAYPKSPSDAVIPINRRRIILLAHFRRFATLTHRRGHLFDLAVAGLVGAADKYVVVSFNQAPE